jgi:hypothetical protein
LPRTLPGYECGPGSTGCSSLKIENNIYGLYVDVDKKKFMIVNETTQSVWVKSVGFSFNQVTPYVISSKHGN